MSSSTISESNPRTHEIDWATLIPASQWASYKCVLDQAIREGIPFALGGGLAVSVYTGNGRYTKDLDLYILPESRSRVIAVMTQCGLSDYYDTLPYDREWIYRGNHGDDRGRDLVDGKPPSFGGQCMALTRPDDHDVRRIVSGDSAGRAHLVKALCAAERPV